jgi:hypothetical protein
MKKPVSFVLIILMVLNTFGFNLIIMFLIQESKTENLEFLDGQSAAIRENLVVFSLKYDKPDFVNSREIRYNNTMFDIVYRKDSADDTILYCINDKKETRFHTAFRSLNDLNDNPESVPDHFVFTIIKNLLKQYLPNPENDPVVNFSSRQFQSAGNSFIKLIVPEKIYPPPQA